MTANFPFSTSTDNKPSKRTLKQWNILIVDDEQSVHDVTRLVLDKKIIENREIHLVSAYSASEAKQLLSRTDFTFAAAFIDVVMEEEHAGLNLVKWIRQELKNRNIRLILRTGQAGVAPEEDVIRDFDINDYKTKTELTSSKLVTSTYNAIRGFRDISIIEKSLSGFQELIQASNHMLRLREVKEFGSAALSHLLSLMDVDSSALYIAHAERDVFQNVKHMVVACTGKFVSEADTLDDIAISDEVRERILDVLKNKNEIMNDEYFIGYFETASNTASVLYIEIQNNGEHLHSHLLSLYSTNVALILENILSRKEIEESQKDLMYIIGDAIEARSKETGAHVKRVSLICDLVARKMDAPELFVNLLKFAAPLHDVGKISIPETILHKPGSLNEEEWKTMQSHAITGAELLERSTSSIAKIGARLARHHHENWDGSGYPDGLAGEAIPLEARIMAVADVFDALGSNRSYKKIWPNEEINSYIKTQKGKKFDPEIAEVLLENFDEFLKIRELCPD